MGKLLSYIVGFAAVLLVTSAGGGVPAASAQQEYRGRACIIAVNAACAARGFKVGDCADMRFLPPNALGNGNNTRFSLFFQNYAQNFRQEGSAIGVTYKKVNFNWVARSGGTAGQSLTQWRIPIVQPANYSLPYLHMIVDFFRYDDFDPSDRSLCNVRWRATAQKYPDKAPSAGSAEARLPELNAATSAAPLGNTLPKIGN